MPAIFPQIIVNGVLQRHVLPSFRRFQLSLFLTCNGYLYRRNQIAGKFNLSALLLSFHWQHLPMSSWQQISTHILKTNLCSPTEDLRSGPSKWVHLAATNPFLPALTENNPKPLQYYTLKKDRIINPTSIFTFRYHQWTTRPCHCFNQDQHFNALMVVATRASMNVDQSPQTAKLLAPQTQAEITHGMNQWSSPCRNFKT